jgi:hypothetical protein
MEEDKKKFQIKAAKVFKIMINTQNSEQTILGLTSPPLSSFDFNAWTFHFMDMKLFSRKKQTNRKKLNHCIHCDIIPIS